jgi:PAS domain S-box-containing protein
MLGLYAAEPSFFNPQEQELLEAIGEDISFALDTMQAEAEAQSTKMLFSKLFQLSPVAKALVRLNDRVFVDVNHSFEQMIGRTREEILGKTADQLNIWADQSLRQQLVDSAILHGPVRDAEFLFYNAAGETRTGLIYADIIHHNNDVFILSNTLDITERKRAENSLHEAQQAQRLQISALEATANAIMITDRDGLLEWINPAFTTLTGYSAAEAVGKNLRELVKSGKQDHAFYRDLWQTITAGKVWRNELINRRKDGMEYIEEQTITPVCNEAGEVTHYVAIKMDVSRDREIQDQIQRQERLAGIGQLAAGIAHDFNNIMAVIVLYSQITARSAHLSDRDRERLMTIHQQADHAAHMIRQILDFSRQGIIKRQPLDLLPILKEHTKLLQRTLPENIEVRLTSEAQGYVVLADPTRIQQTVMNLAVNARDAMPTGGTLHIHLKRAYFTNDNAPLAKMEAGHWVCLTISDTGTGIPQDNLPHLFEPFFTTKPPGKGTGLGLPQVYGIVGEHGGYITVDSELGKGTTFTIYLPEREAAISQPEVTALADLPQGNLETVLVVEDNPVVRVALVEALQQLNYRTQEAADGEAALALLSTTEGVDIILTDLVMPKMGGTELVRALHAQGNTTPIVVMTGHPLDNDIEALHALGINSWLNKPPTSEQLSKAIAESLIRESSG